MKNKSVYFFLAAWMLWGGTACEDKTFDEFVSGTDDYTTETGSDYYKGGIDVSHYDKARTFPGLVDTLTEKRLDEAIVVIDMGLPVVENSKAGLFYTPLPIYSTGLYAGAGEKVTIVLDEDVKGLSVQIGIHDVDLSSALGDIYFGRDPKIVASMPLFQGSNEIRNPYGGYIWIKRNNDVTLETVNLKIQGVYAAPDFISGEIEGKEDEWMNIIKETTVPWMELRGKNVVFSVPTNYIKQKVQSLGDVFPKQLKKALDLWDEWVRCYLEFYGLDGVDEAFPMPGFPVREVMDTHLSTERYSYYNNTCVNQLATEELISVICDPEEIKKATINTGHVVGWLQASMFKQTYFPASFPYNFNDMFLLLPNYYFLYKNNWWGQTGQIELPSFYEDQKAIKKKSYTLKPSAFERLISWAQADSCKIYSDEASRPTAEEYGGVHWPVALYIYSSILQYKQDAEQKDGWKYFGYLNRFLLEEAKKNMGKMNMQDAMLKCLTDYFDRDFSQLFDRVGIAIADARRKEALEKPHVEKCIWMFDPLSHDKQVDDFDGKAFQTRVGTGYIPNHHLRNEWEAVAYSKDWKHNNYNWRDRKTPYLLFDGDCQSMWESYYDRYSTYTKDGKTYQAFYGDSVYYKAQTPELPYSIVIQPGATALPVLDGIYMAAGYRLSSSVYAGDAKTGDWWYSFRPQRICVYVTHDPLEYHYQDSTFVNIEKISWQPIYDSNDEKSLGPDKKQYWPDRYNTFYVEFDKRYIDVTGIRLEIPEISHKEPARPEDMTEEEYPKRPKEPNWNLERIHMFGEFGTYYYKEER